MDTLLSFTSNKLWDTYRTENINGKEFLVISGIPLSEGVLNGRFVSAHEFGKFVNDWDDCPVVLRHPKTNGGSAKVSNPDVPIVGRFYNAKLDGKRLVGDFWLDKQLIENLQDKDGNLIGQDLLSTIYKRHPIEVSTGYWSETIPQIGTWNGQDYQGVDQNIRADHIALLPDEVGACSVADGCGLNRNQLTSAPNAGVSVSGCRNCYFLNAVTKKEAWGEESAGSYLIVGDPEKVTTWHLPIKKNGKLDRGLAGRAWSELFSGGRTGKGYQGPDKEKAKAKLRRIYKDNDWPVPGETKQNAAASSYEGMMERIYQAFSKEFDVSNKDANSTDYWIVETHPNYVICVQNGEYYSVGYSIRDGDIVFDDKSEWKKAVRVEDYVVVQNVTGSLPEEGKRMWEKVYNAALEQYDGDKEKAAATAWAQIKKKYKKDESGNWVLIKKNQQDLEGLAVALLFTQMIDS